ncbi:hypothetical protein GCM10010464_80070 [Pseudonocardia yunnanensis]
MVRTRAYYRCKASRLAPGSPAPADHPVTVNLREKHLAEAINACWDGCSTP